MSMDRHNRSIQLCEGSGQLSPLLDLLMIGYEINATFMGKYFICNFIQTVEKFFFPKYDHPQYEMLNILFKLHCNVVGRIRDTMVRVLTLKT